LTRLEKDLDETTKQLNIFRELESEDNPALASILVFKAYGLMKENPYVLWKVLQEKLGGQWFVDVLIDRSKNHKYAIDYEPIEDILPTLNKLLIKHKPEKIDFMAGENGDFIKYVVETFQEQMSVCWKSVVDKESLIDQMHRETITFVHRERKRSDERRDDDGYEPKTSEDDPRKEWEEAKTREIDMYKKKISILVSELKNLQSDIVAQSHLNIILEKRFNLILLTFKDVFQKVGSELDLKNFKNNLDALRKVDAKTLQTLGIDKALATKKIELLAKLVIQNTAVKHSANKSTSTNTQTYTDLIYDDVELMGTLIAKIKQSFPGKIEGRSGYDGKSGYEGSKYSKSNNKMVFMNSQASKFFINNDKKKPSSNFNNLSKRFPDQGSFRNDMSYYDGSIQGSYDELRPDNHSNHHPNGKLGSELDGATSPRSKNHSIDSKLGHYKPQPRNPQISPSGKLGKNPGHNDNYSSRTIEDGLEFPNKFTGRAGQTRRSDVMSMLPNMTYSPDKGGNGEKFIEMSNTDRKKNRGDSANRKMSMFVSRDEVEYLRTPNMLHTSKIGKDNHALSTSNDKIQEKSKERKNKDPKTKHMDGNLNDFLTVSNIKEGKVLNTKDLPSVRLIARQGERRANANDPKQGSSNLDQEANLNPNDSRKKEVSKKNIRPLQDAQSKRYLDPIDTLSGDLDSKDQIIQKERPSSKGKTQLFDLIEANRETPDSELHYRVHQNHLSQLSQLETRNERERIRSQKKKRTPVRLDIFLLDAIQVGLTQDVDMGMYLKIISNHQTNYKLLGNRYKVVESLLKGPQNFLIYLSKRPGSRVIRQEERRLLEIIEQKTTELERIKSNYQLYIRYDYRKWK
jgi:hypothetical protein